MDSDEVPVDEPIRAQNYNHILDPEGEGDDSTQVTFSLTAREPFEKIKVWVEYTDLETMEKQIDEGYLTGFDETE